MGKFRGILWMI
jgi:hypothetical protein